MAISLDKGQRINLSKDFGVGDSISQLAVGLGWDTNKYDGGEAFDLDACAFLLDVNDKAYGKEHFIFYGNEVSVGGAVTHSGDNKTGAGAGDDETVFVDVSKLPSDIVKIAFTVTIHNAVERGQNFGQVSNAYVRIYNKVTGQELVRFDLEEDYSTETALVVGEIYNKGGDWRFGAVGDGYNGGLLALATSYGLDVTN